jgi:hypothetical protein
MLMVCLIPKQVSAQLLQENFDTYTCADIACGGNFNIDDNDCLSDWVWWYGTPSIINNTVSVPAPDNHLYLHFNNTITGVQGVEGAIATLPQQGEAGDILSLSFEVLQYALTSQPANYLLNIYIADGVQGDQWSMPICLEPQPSLAGETIQLLGSYSVNQFNGINWVDINIDSVCAEIPYSQLIFATVYDGSSGTSSGAVYVDDILLTLDAEAVQLSPPTVTVDAVVPDLCDEGNTISVTYKICAEQDITVEIDASANLSVTAQPASQTINIAAGTCEEITIVYTEASDLADGSIIEFTLDLETNIQNSLCEVPSVESTFSHTYEKVCFSEYPCLEEGSGFTLVPAGDFSTLINDGYLLPSAQAVSQPQKLLFEGDVLMDEFDYTFAAGSELYFAPGVELDVDENKTLEIYSSTLQGCDKLWKGIKLNLRSYLRLEESTISDALYAIEALNLCRFTLFKNDFVDNYIGLYQPDEGSISSVTQVDFPMIFNTFITSEFGLLPPYEDQPVTSISGGIGRAGIVLDNCRSLQIGMPIFTFQPIGNDFENLQNGIISFNSDITVAGPLIKDMVGNFDATLTSFPGINGDFQQLQGFGIFSDGDESSSLKVEKGRIEDMVRGIHVQSTGNSVVEVTETEFIDLQDGIIMASWHGIFDINIKDNNPVQFRQYGVGYFNQSGIIEALNVEDNTITQTSGSENYPLMAGVRLSNQFWQEVRANVFSNTITALEFGCDGIHLDRCRNSIVEGNDIDHIGTQSGFFRGGPTGVFVEEGESNFIFSNVIDYAITGGQAISRGIEAINHPAGVYCCNSTDGHTQGLRFKGNSPGSIRQNELNTHDIGLLCEENTAIGLQEHPGNQWLGTYSGASARHLGTETFVFLSRYRVQGAQGSILYPNGIDVPNSTIQWFQPFSGQAADSCAVDDGCSVFVGEGEKTRLDSLLLIGSFGNELVMDWRLKRSLYQKLKAYPSLRTEHPALDTFYNDYTGHTLETLDSLERGHSSLFALTTAEQEAWSANRDSVAMLYADLDDVYEDLHNATTALDSAALFEEFRVLDSLLGVTMATRRAWALQWQEESVLDAIDLAAYGQGASDSLLAADLELQVYQLLLSNIAQGDWVLDSLQLDTLAGIANQCPDIGGPGVLHARAVLSAYQSTSYNDSLFCSVQQLIALPENTSIRMELTAGLQVFPNPAQERVNLQWETDARQVQVYSAVGQLMAQHPLEEASRYFELSLEGYAKGLYFLTLHLKDGTSSTVRLIKQ